MRNVLALFVGLLFGLGLCLSGMSNPAKVTGFLDLAGAWDPSLAFVMAGAIAVAFPAFRLARKGRRDLAGETIALPNPSTIDAPLVAGAAIFGVGWGLGGVCPGPGVVDVGFLSLQALLFVVAMAAGITLCRVIDFGLRAPRALTQDA